MKRIFLDFIFRLVNKYSFVYVSILLSQIAQGEIFHERVIWTTDPDQKAVISWSSDIKGQKSAVKYGLAPDKLSKVQRADLDGRFDDSEDDPVYYHHVQLEGLEPGTWYWFQVITDNQVSSVWKFLTAPKNGESDYRLIFGGDSRSDQNQRELMNRVMAKAVQKHPDILALVFGGDFIESGDNFDQWYWWLTDFTKTRVNDRILPIVPIRGNHEGNDVLFDQVWNWPGADGNYFTTEIGSVAIVNLNTNISHYGDQRNWLESELKRLSQTHPIIFANYHRPAFPAVKSPGSARKAWVPLFEDYQLDLVFESDGHVYKKTAPIYREKIDEERGIVYVGEGGLGVRMRTPKDHWYFGGSGFASSDYHFQMVTIEKDGFVYEAIDDQFISFGKMRRPVQSGRQSLLK